MPESALREAVPNDFISSHFAVLPNRVPGPVFLRRISASWRLAHPPCGYGLLCRSCIKLDGHSVFNSRLVKELSRDVKIGFSEF